MNIAVLLLLAVAAVASASAKSPWMMSEDPEGRAIVRLAVPTSGPVEGGTQVNVYGNFGKDEGDNFSCRFGEDGGPETAGERVSAAVLRCTSPAAKDGAGKVKLYVRKNDKDWSAKGAAFTYTETQASSATSGEVHNVSPVSATTAGGTQLLVRGANFGSSASDDFVCIFTDAGDDAKSVETAARRLSTKILRCPTPEHAAGSVKLAVRKNDDEPTNGVDFAFTEPASDSAQPVHVKSLAPAQGDIGGGAQIVVYGTNFGKDADDTFKCRFGTMPAVTGRRVTATVIRCPVPACTLPACKVTPLPTDDSTTVPFKLQKNDDAWTEDDIKFKYVIREELSTTAVTVKTISPAQGPVSGGTQVRVYGQFGNSALVTYACRFGTTEVPARRVSPRVVVCTSPETSSPGKVDLAVRSTGTEWSQAKTYEFLPAESTEDDAAVSLGDLERVDPATSAIQGGAQVIVHGKDFGTDVFSTFQCRFGDAKIVTGRRISKTALMCSAPAVKTAGVVKLSVRRNNGPWSATQLDFEFVSHAESHMTISYVAPTRGMAGTQIFVHGSGFGRDQDAFFSCKFGSKMSPARRISDSIMSCMAPAQAALGAVTVEVLQDGAAPTNSGIQFVYSDIVDDVDGGTKVILQKQSVLVIAGVSAATSVFLLVCVAAGALIWRNLSRPGKSLSGHYDAEELQLVEDYRSNRRAAGGASMSRREPYSDELSLTVED